MPRLEKEQSPGGSESGEAGTPHEPARTQRELISEHFSSGVLEEQQVQLQHCQSSGTLGCLGLSLCSNAFCTPGSFPLNTHQVSAGAFSMKLRLYLDLGFPTVTISCRMHTAAWGHFPEPSNKNHSLEMCISANSLGCLPHSRAASARDSSWFAAARAPAGLLSCPHTSGTAGPRAQLHLLPVHTSIPPVPPPPMPAETGTTYKDTNTFISPTSPRGFERYSCEN